MRYCTHDDTTAGGGGTHLIATGARQILKIPRGGMRRSRTSLTKSKQFQGHESSAPTQSPAGQQGQPTSSQRLPALHQHPELLAFPSFRLPCRGGSTRGILK